MAAAYLRARSAVMTFYCSKQVFESRAMAMRAVGRIRKGRQLVAHGHGVLSAYRCSRCGYYHLGNK